MPCLYIVSTPIGNLEDITLRALRILSEADVIFAEDTRVTKRLLTRHNISVPLAAWHQHSSDSSWQRVRAHFVEEKTVAFVTDAGTPGISDPGGHLIARVRSEFPQYRIVPLPGPSALTAALSIAGIPTDRFLFLGFLPHKKGRQTLLTHIGESEIPVVLFESVHRIQKLLGELAAIDKQVIVCRELTKQFETVYRGHARDIAIPAAETRGEFVVIIYS